MSTTLGSDVAAQECSAERNQQREMDMAKLSLPQAIRNRFGLLREAGDRLAGGGLRSLVKRRLRQMLRGPISRPFLRTRAEILLTPVSRDSRIIEIGPSYSPIAPKADGWNTKTLDHTTREELISHYRGQPGVDVNRIEDVDFIWTGGYLTDAVPEALHGTFDAFIASHVIEHTPDLIGFLGAAAAWLKPEGVVILAVPDKRYCFDYFQPLTTTGQLLAAHAERRSRHTRRIAFDHVAYAVQNGGVGTWGQYSVGKMCFAHPFEEARKLFDSISASGNYVDLHAWRFTPASFELLLLELARLGETDWRVDSITPANGCEFFAWLRRGGGAAAASLAETDFAARRLRLLKQALLETKAQIDWLIAGEPTLIKGGAEVRKADARLTS